jgi:GR25 family glycosyltransferase involved in LPS biosynthesis|tara:strand:- start:206 stop:994 length:789 start_codon:yes stop_codon:yes gene_type:complete
MDKNKSASKLKDLPHIYWINLDGKEDRRLRTEQMLSYWEVANTRISAYDGREDDLSDIVYGKYPDNMSSGEIGCVTSHLKAIQYWMETSDDEYAIIMEDDCDMDSVKHWPFTWKEWFRWAPAAWDILQLAVINPAIPVMQIHHRFVNDFSTAAYVINRTYAKKLLGLYLKKGKYKLDCRIKPRSVADDLIYNSGLTFSMPIFMYRCDMGSDIHDQHVDVYHKNCHDALWNFWRNDAPLVEDWNQYFDLNPYLGKLPPGFEGA